MSSGGLGRRRFVAGLGVIAVAALAIRVAYILLLERTERFGGDAFYYHGQANLIADGRGFVEPYLLELTGRALPTAYHPPLYPLALSIVSVLNDSVLAHQLASAMIGTATVVLVGVLGRRLGGFVVGLAAGGIAAVYPGLWISDGLLMAETPAAFLVAAVMLATYHHFDRRTGPSAALLGAACGLAILTRGETLLLVPMLVVPACLVRRRPVAPDSPAGLSGRRRLGHAALALGATSAVLLPWVVRNLTVFEEPVLLSTNDGSTLAVANCDSTYSGPLLGYWDFDCLHPPAPPEESLAQEHWRDVGLSYARDNLDRLPVVVSARVGRMWSLYRPAQMIDLDTHVEGRDRRLAIAGLAGYYALVPLAAVGTVALRRRRVPVFPLLAPFALVTVTAAVFYGITRFRISAEVPLVVLAGVGLVHLAQRAQRARSRAGTTGEDARPCPAPGVAARPVGRQGRE